MSKFYHNIEKLDKLKSKSKPCAADCKQMLEIITGDKDLTVHFYKGNTNPVWIKLLKDSGEFEKLGGSDDEVGVCQEAQAKYLVNVAEQEQSQEEVLEIFTGIENLHRFIRGDFVDALLHMRVDIAVKGVPLILGYIKGREKKDWYFACYHSAKLMAELAEKYPKEAFAIAKELLEVWVPKDQKRMSRDIESKFRAFEYETIVFKFFSKLWDVDAYRSTELLIELLDGYINEVQSGNDYEVTTHWYIHYERLDQMGERPGRDILASLIRAICQAGKKVIESQPEKTGELLTILQGLEKEIFRRIEMYLLRFVPPETKKARINDIISNKDYRETTGYKYEYKFLLRGKYNELNETVIQEYLQWVDSKEFDKVEKENISSWFQERKGRPATDDDYDEILNLDKARELYLVREVFPEQYKEYKAKSKREEGEIAPKPRLGTGVRIDSEEGAPLSVEEMVKMKAEDVLAYIIDEDKWKDKKPTSFFNTPEEALVSAFGKAVQQQVGEYIKLNPDELKKLKPDFLSRYFDGIWAGLRENEADSKSWENVLKTATAIIEEKIEDEGFEYCFKNILNLVGHKLSQKSQGEHHVLIWTIIEPLTKYQYNPENILKPESEKDPYDECINCVQGEAFELAIRFGLGCKKELSEYYEKTLSKQIRDVLDFIAKEQNLPNVLCVFGVWFVQLHWMEKDWIEKNIDLILSESDIKRWDAVWGSYVTWGRPAPKAFNLLTERGKYNNAIERIGEANSFSFRNDTEEGLVGHLMIGFFNGWIAYEHNVIQNFLKKAPAKLRGHAARFLTTGFKDIKEKTDIEESKKQEYGERLKLYWQNRLGEISKNREENIEEIQEFAIWVKDSLFDNKETLDLLYETLRLSEGKIGEQVDSVEFVEGICDAAKGNEIKAIQCLKMAFNEPEMRMDSTFYKESLDTFFESIIGLEDDYSDIDNIRKEAIILVDTIGRLCPDLRDDYGKLYTDLNEKIKRV